MQYFEKKQFVNEEGIEIVELVSNGTCEARDLEDDADPNHCHLTTKFVGILPRPIVVTMLPLNLGGKMIKIPVMAMQDSYVPLEATTLKAAFTEYTNKLKQIEQELADAETRAKIALPSSAMGKEGLIV